MELKESLAVRLGQRVRTIRQGSGLTIKRLAEETNLSSPFISRLERGQTMPSIPTLQAIADTLKVDIESFFRRDEEQSGYAISRRGGRRSELSIRGPDQKINYEVELLAAEMDNPLMEPALVTALSKDREADVEPAVHGGQEFCYVVEGTLELTLGGKKFVLRKGDCAYFLGQIPHKGVSLGTRPAKTLNVHLVPGRRAGTFQTRDDSRLRKKGGGRPRAEE